MRIRFFKEINNNEQDTDAHFRKMLEITSTIYLSDWSGWKTMCVRVYYQFHNLVFVDKVKHRPRLWIRKIFPCVVVIPIDPPECRWNELKEWLDNNIGPQRINWIMYWMWPTYSFAFRRKKDALVFKLKWG